MAELGEQPERVVPFFWALPEEERALLEADGAARAFPAGETLWHQGDPSDHVLIIRRGCVKVVSSARGGAQLMLGIRGPGDIVGELAGLDGHPRRGTVITIDDVETLVIKGPRFVQLLSERPAISIAIARMVSERLAEADSYRLTGGSTGVQPALARLMLDLARRYGSPTVDGGVTLGVSLSQADLADCLAVSLRTVARTFASWRNRGVISTERRMIVIRKPSSLRMLTGS